MDIAHDAYVAEINAMGENIWVENAETESDGQRNKVTPPDIAKTMTIMRVELQS